MAATAKLRGNTVTFDDTKKAWNKPDNVELCSRCGKPPAQDGHDACIANLPSVAHACCGHGDDDSAYAVLDNGDRLFGVEATQFFKGEKSEP